MTGVETVGCTESEHRIQFYLDQDVYLEAGNELGYELLNNTELIFVPL